MNPTSEDYEHMGMVMLAIHKIETDQREILGEVIGGTEEGIFECISHFSEKDFERARSIGKRLEEKIDNEEITYDD